MKIAAVLVAILALAAPFQPPRPDMAAWVPSGPLLYLEARDFGALLRDWNASGEKSAWLDSANYEVFTRSRLFGRLGEAWQEFAAAAGFNPDMQALEPIAGGHSVLALYDIGKLEFLYISAAPSANVMESVLWQSRAKYESRNAGGSPFYVHADPASGRVVAFAVYRDYVLLGTREELVAGALRLLAGEKPAAVNQDPWFRESVRAAGSPGDLRLVMNLETIVRTPYFRSYWIQRNNTMLQPYWAGIADTRLTPTEIREDRVLLRSTAEPGPPAAPSAGVAALARLVPDDAGLYRAWAAPEVSAVADLIRDKLLDPEVSRALFGTPRGCPKHPMPAAGRISKPASMSRRSPIAAAVSRSNRCAICWPAWGTCRCCTSRPAAGSPMECSSKPPAPLCWRARPPGIRTAFVWRWKAARTTWSSPRAEICSCWRTPRTWSKKSSAA